MRWLFARQTDRPYAARTPAAVTSDAQSAKKAVDDGLRRWRASVVPLEDLEGIGDRRAKTLSTIGAAMRQAQIEQRQSQQHRRLRVALSAAALLLGLGGVVYAGFGHSLPGSHTREAHVEDGAVLVGQARLSGHSGPVWIGTSGSGGALRQPALGAGAAETLAVGERVITRVGGEAGLDVGMDTQVQLHEQSELLLARNDHSEKRLSLSDGAIDVAVEPASSSKRKVVVETPDATVIVHGTVFSVAVARESGHSTTTVSVRRGIVAVMQNGVEQRRLRAGQSWSSHAARASLPPVEPSAGSGSMPTTSAPSTTKARVTTSAAVPARPAAKQREVAAEVVPLDAPSSTLDQENGLFRLAIDARNTGDDAGAVRRFDQLLGTYPKSALAQEAKVERFRALKRMGRSRDAAREARRYLIEHGNGFAEDEARDVALTP